MILNIKGKKRPQKNSKKKHSHFADKLMKKMDRLETMIVS